MDTADGEPASSIGAHWARELHDETLQGLGAVHLQMLRGLAPATPDRELLEGAAVLLRAEIARLRELIAQLRAPALAERGLTGSLVALAERTGSPDGLRVAHRIGLDGVALDADAQLAVYRIVQHALDNVAQHADAAEAQLEVTRIDGSIVVRVHDDGRGFDPAAPTEGLGLTGMRERVELLGGTLDVRSTPRSGTTLRATVPLPH
jgi:signal transduction histidine kinase